MESIASGLVVAQNCLRKLKNLTKMDYGVYTILGNLMRYVLTPNDNFQPMNANFGLLPPIKTNIRDKKLKKQAYADRSIVEMSQISKKYLQEE